MKTRPQRPVRLLLLFALLTAAPAAHGEDEDRARRAPADFHRWARIHGEVAAGEAHAVRLSAAAVAAQRAGGELRLFDADGREIPSLLETASERPLTALRPAHVFNRAWTEDGAQTLSLELGTSPPEPVNELSVEVEGGDHHLRVRVEGSDDGRSWGILADDLHLIRHEVESEGIEYVHDILRIPEARYRYYRLTLVPHADPRAQVESDRPPEVAGVSVRRAVPRGAALTVPVEAARFDDPRDDDPRRHYWRLELPEADMGVDRVELDIPDDGYARSASLWEWSEERGRRTRRLASTVLFRFGDDAQTTLEGFQTNARHLVLMIDQGDDAPVTVDGVRASRPLQHLKFLAPDAFAAPLAIYFEPDEARKPRYDLARLLREREITRFRDLRHAGLETNPAYREPPAPRSEELPYLLYVLVVVFVGGIAWYVWRTVERGLPADEDG